EARSGFEQEHGAARILRQSRRQRTAAGSGTDDDHVVARRHPPLPAIAIILSLLSRNIEKYLLIARYPSAAVTVKREALRRAQPSAVRRGRGRRHAWSASASSGEGARCASAARRPRSG